MRDLWTSRSTHERAMLALVGAFALVVLFVAFVWLPLERSHARLAEQVPALRASLATLERQAGEAQRLRALPPRAPSAAREPLASLATAAGGKALPGAQISVLDGRTVRVIGTDVSFGALLEWLAAVQAAQGLRVDSARIDALPVPGRVRAELQLSRL